MNVLVKNQIKKAAEAAVKETGNASKRLFAVMLFDTEMHLGLSSNPTKWVNYENRIYYDGSKALLDYLNLPSLGTQLTDGESPEELEAEMDTVVNNFEDQDWLNTHVFSEC